MTEIQELREIVQAQAKRLTDTRAIAQLNERRDDTIWNWMRILENALADARRDNTDLVKLVGRMGRDLDGHCLVGFAREYRYPYTIIGQREHDAAMHEAEGAPEGHELVEDIQ